MADRIADSGVAAVTQQTFERLDEIGALIRRGTPFYVRHSRGYETDLAARSVDGESGLELPGLSANPMNPEPWWTRPWQDWVARQICQYRHLSKEDGAQTWLLTGRPVGRGPDCEPLLVDVEPLGVLSERLIIEAEERYDQNFTTNR
jgi:hypothetical protein